MMPVLMAKQKNSSQSRPAGIGAGEGYLDRTHRPLQCLIFLTPLLLFYQIGSSVHPWNPGQGRPPNVIAFLLMLRFFAFFGAMGGYLPLLAVIAVLLIWHLSRKDPWTIDPVLYVGMLAESILWALPLLLLASLITTGPAVSNPAVAQAGSVLPWQTQAVLSVGAGIYEELLFRLILITLLNILLVDMLGLSAGKAIPLIIITSAVLFSLYHYLGHETPAWNSFFFRTAAGIYFAAVFIFRGFGVDVGTHAAYDLILVFLQYSTHHG